MGEKFDEWATLAVMLVTNVAMGSVNALVKRALDGGVNHMVIATYRLAISAFFLAPFAYFWERPQPIFLFAWAFVHVVDYFVCLRQHVAGNYIHLDSDFQGLFPNMLNVHSHTEGLNSHHPTKTNKTAKNWLVGCMFLFLGSLFQSSWLLFQAKIIVNYPCSYSSTVLMSIFASFQCSLLSLAKSPRGVHAWLLRDKFVIFVVIYAGVVGQAVPTVALSWTLKKRGPVFASTFYPVMLISATLMDVIILHNPLYFGSIIGSIISIMGLYIFLWGKNKHIEAVMRLPPSALEVE